MNPKEREENYEAMTGEEKTLITIDFDADELMRIAVAMKARNMKLSEYVDYALRKALISDPSLECANCFGTLVMSNGVMYHYETGHPLCDPDGEDSPSAECVAS